MPAPAAVLLDVNETLSDLQPLRRRFEEVGAPGELLELWFASTLRDGFALTAAGGYADFHAVALDVLRRHFAHVETWKFQIAAEGQSMALRHFRRSKKGSACQS